MATLVHSSEFVSPIKVVCILKTDPILIKNWLQFADSLGLSSTDTKKLKNELSSNTIEPYELYRRILRKWIALNESHATIGTLANVLKGIDNQSLHDSLLEFFDFKTIIVEQKESPLKAKWWPEKKILVNSFLKRRDHNELIVEKLNRSLCNKDTNATVINQQVGRCTVFGMGGIGKTTLAKWYGNYYEAEYDFIIWIDCGEGRLRESLIKLQQSISKVYSKKELDTEECFNILGRHQCLLIYDNAESYTGTDGVKSVLPKQQNQFHILITSRSKDWGHDTMFGKIQEYSLGVFSIEEGIGFLRKNIKSVEYSEKDLVEICTLVDHLPLALQISVAILNKGNRNIKEFIDSLKTTNDLITRNVGLDDYKMPVNITLTITIEKVIAEPVYGELAHKLLQYLAYLPPDNIYIDYFADLENVSLHLIKSAVELLDGYSLVSFDNGKTISIHRLLQKVLREINKGKKESVICKILSSKTKYWDYIVSAYMEARKISNLTHICSFVSIHLLKVFHSRYYTSSMETLIKDHIEECKEATITPDYNHLISMINFAFISYNEKRYDKVIYSFERIYKSVVAGTYLLKVKVMGVVYIGFYTHGLKLEAYRSVKNYCYPGYNMAELNQNTLDALHKSDTIEFIDENGSIFLLNIIYLCSLHSLGRLQDADIKLLQPQVEGKEFSLVILEFKGDLYYKHLIQCLKNVNTLTMAYVELIVEERDFRYDFTNCDVTEVTFKDITFKNAAGSVIENFNMLRLIPLTCKYIKISFIYNHVIDISQLPECCLNIHLSFCTVLFPSGQFRNKVQELNMNDLKVQGDINNYFKHSQNLLSLKLP